MNLIIARFGGRIEEFQWLRIHFAHAEVERVHFYFLRGDHVDIGIANNERLHIHSFYFPQLLNNLIGLFRGFPEKMFAIQRNFIRTVPCDSYLFGPLQLTGSPESLTDLILTFSSEPTVSSFNFAARCRVPGAHQQPTPPRSAPRVAV